MPRQKIASFQRWSETYPEVLLDYTKSDKPNKDKPGWVVSIDTPNYGHYCLWMDKYGSTSMTYSECEEALKTLLC